jgi:hypothetical protein
LGNVVIIQEGAGHPDDNGSGGKIKFVFECAVDINTITLLDVDANEGGVVCAFRDSDGAALPNVTYTGLANHSVKTINVNRTDVKTIVVKLADSGAVAQICYCLGPNCS